MRLVRFVVPALLLCLPLVSCNSSTDTDNDKNQNPNGNNSTFGGSVDGTPWVATIIVAVNVDGDIAITARDAQNREVAIDLADATTTTQYPIGPGQPNNARYHAASDAWVGHLANATGYVTLTSVSATRAVGSYTLNLVPQTTGATGTKVLVGTFDIYFMQQT